MLSLLNTIAEINHNNFFINIDWRVPRTFSNLYRTTKRAENDAILK